MTHTRPDFYRYDACMHWENAKSELLKAVYKPRLGLITDVDGTLSPIVDVPDEARVTPQNLELLAALQTQLTLIAVVSGRSAEDVYQRVGLPGLVYLGNHGMEAWQGGKAIVSPVVAGYRENLSTVMPEINRILVEGMRFEDKGATLSVHYRQTSDPDQVGKDLEPLMQAIANRYDLRLF